MRTHQRERGSASLELAILTAPLLAVLSLTVVVGRISLANLAVNQAAYDAAAAAAEARDPATAQTDAHTAAAAALSGRNVDCAQLDVTVDTSGFAVPVGLSASVTVTVSCQVDVADLALPGIPSAYWETSVMVEPLDTYRGR
jgi:Flp pilus assembly protein TadG